MDQQDREDLLTAMKSHVVAIEDLQERVLMIALAIKELNERLYALEATAMVHDAALYPEGHPPIGNEDEG